MPNLPTRAEARRLDRQREYDRTRAVELYLRGHSLLEISIAVGVSRRTLSLDLGRVRQRWLASQIRDWDELQAVELARIDQIESAAWDGYDASKQGTKKRKHVKGLDSKGGKDIRLRETTTSSGNPKFLEVALRCIGMRCKILGIDQARDAGALSEAQSSELVTYTTQELEAIVAVRNKALARQRRARPQHDPDAYDLPPAIAGPIVGEHVAENLVEFAEENKPESASGSEPESGAECDLDSES
jgi:hypothetical protein